MDKVLSKEQVKEVAVAAQIALDEVAARFGMTVKVGGGTYFSDTGEYKPKVQFMLADEGAERRLFEAKAPQIWLADYPDEEVLPSDYGTILTLRDGKNYRLTGLNPRAPKHPFLVELEDEPGHPMRLTAAAIVQIRNKRNA